MYKSYEKGKFFAIDKIVRFELVKLIGNLESQFSCLVYILNELRSAKSSFDIYKDLANRFMFDKSITPEDLALALFNLDERIYSRQAIYDYFTRLIPEIKHKLYPVINNDLTVMIGCFVNYEKVKDVVYLHLHLINNVVITTGVFKNEKLALDWLTNPDLNPPLSKIEFMDSLAKGG